MKGRDQTARTYRAWVERDETKLNSLNEPYTALRARAYMVRTPENQSLIAEIDAGIKKEVSVGCAIATKACSICGANRHTEPCAHLPGRFYDGKLCHTCSAEQKTHTNGHLWQSPLKPKAGVTKAYSTWGTEGIQSMKGLAQHFKKHGKRYYPDPGTGG